MAAPHCPGHPRPILERALQLQIEHGTAYDMPFGTDAYRKSVIEQYWKLDASSGWGPANVLATAGGRDALIKVYQAMMALGHGRQGDLVMVSRVPWISYNWGPYGLAPMCSGRRAILHRDGHIPKTRSRKA